MFLGPGVLPLYPHSPVSASHLFWAILAAGLILAKLPNHVSWRLITEAIVVLWKAIYLLVSPQGVSGGRGGR